MSKGRARVEHHHTIGFDSIEKIDWHLRNLFAGGFQCIQPMPRAAHRRHEKKKSKARELKRWREAGYYLAPKQYAKLFGTGKQPIVPAAVAV